MLHAPFIMLIEFHYMSDFTGTLMLVSSMIIKFYFTCITCKKFISNSLLQEAAFQHDDGKAENNGDVE